MGQNDFLKKYKRDDMYTSFAGRYLIFLFNDKYPVGGYGDITTAFDTLQEIQSAFTINAENEIEIVRLVTNSDDIVPTYTYMDILDMEERRFINVSTLHFDRR